MRQNLQAVGGESMQLRNWFMTPQDVGLYWREAAFNFTPSLGQQQAGLELEAHMKPYRLHRLLRSSLLLSH